MTTLPTSLTDSPFIEPVGPTRSALGEYRDLPAISGPSFLPVSLLGRLPVAMTPVAILTFVAAQTGSLTAAGLAATATATGSGIGAPAMGLLADRFGQRAVLAPAVLVNAAALLVLAGPGSTNSSARLLLCALVGLTMPQVGAMARARWLALTRTRITAAFAFEGTADETAYVLGPALAGILGALAGPRATLVAAAGLALFAAGGFAVHRTHASTARPTSTTPALQGTPNPATGGIARVMVGPVLAMALMGAFFASTQSALTAYAAGRGLGPTGGLLYAAMAVGSAVTALLTPALPPRIGPRLRCAVAAVGLVAGLALTFAASGGGPLGVAGAVLVTGLSVGPMLVTLNAHVGARVPVARGAGAMAFMSAGVVAGIAVGALLAGTAAQAVGAPGALLVAAVAAALLLPTTVVGLR